MTDLQQKIRRLTPQLDSAHSLCDHQTIDYLDSILMQLRACVHTERLKALLLNMDSQMLGHQYKLLGASQFKATS